MPHLIKQITLRMRWFLLASLIYLLTTSLVLVFEYTSELSKIDRGFFTDTFSPFFFTHILTFPTSELVQAWSGYPESFEAQQYRNAVQQAIPKEIFTILLQYSIIVALLFFGGVVPEKRGWGTK